MGKGRQVAGETRPDVVNSETDIRAYNHDPDVQLMLRAKRGDDAAFSQLVENGLRAYLGIP